MRLFLTVYTEILDKATVSLAVWVTGLMIFQVKTPDVAVLSWLGYACSVGFVRPVDSTAKFSKKKQKTMKAVYGTKMNTQLMSNSSGGHSCS